MYLLPLCRWPHRLALLAILCISALTLGSKAIADDSITFGAPPWPGITVKSEVASQILQALDYQTDATNASTSMLLYGIENNQIDALLGVWVPAQSAMLKPFLEKGSAVKLVANMTDLRYRVAVPQYVCDAGVHSLADLADHDQKFGKKIYGIEPGDAGNQIMIDAINDGTYNLSGWQLVASSTAGMLAQVGQAIKQHKWIAFHAWEPHWMNLAYDICYLDDPKNIWGGNSSVLTIVRAKLGEDRPNVTRFLSQFIVPNDAQNTWTYNYSFKDQPLQQVAHKWIASHPDIVQTWVKGVVVKGSDQSAATALAKAFDWPASDSN